MPTNKSHWYDGVFYDTFIAPNQDRMFSVILKEIPTQSKVLDVGCGTGRFSFNAAQSVESVVGIDLSAKNISVANSNLAKTAFSNISFLHASVADIKAKGLHFDVAVMTYVIHEVNPSERIPLLKDILAVSDSLIIGEYLVPRQSGVFNILNEVVEFAAGKEHYQNFKSFVALGGVHGLAKQAGVHIVKEINNQPTSAQIVQLSR